jgi:hypothetical protein
MSGTMSLDWANNENTAWSVVILGRSLTLFETRLCTLAESSEAESFSPEEEERSGGIIFLPLRAACLWRAIDLETKRF